MTADEAIRLGHALERFDLAWIEDPVVWMDVDGHKQVADALQVPVCGGEPVRADGTLEPQAGGT
jgi:L-alanine-DL-glutamate epimerase-like enolase superfamily enzyme